MSKDSEKHVSCHKTTQKREFRQRTAEKNANLIKGSRKKWKFVKVRHLKNRISSESWEINANFDKKPRAKTKISTFANLIKGLRKNANFVENPRKIIRIASKEWQNSYSAKGPQKNVNLVCESLKNANITKGLRKKVNFVNRLR